MEKLLVKNKAKSSVRVWMSPGKVYLILLLASVVLYYLRMPVSNFLAGDVDLFYRPAVLPSVNNAIQFINMDLHPTPYFLMYLYAQLMMFTALVGIGFGLIWVAQKASVYLKTKKLAVVFRPVAMCFAVIGQHHFLQEGQTLSYAYSLEADAYSGPIDRPVAELNYFSSYFHGERGRVDRLIQHADSAFHEARITAEIAKGNSLEEKLDYLIREGEKASSDFSKEMRARNKNWWE